MVRRSVPGLNFTNHSPSTTRGRGASAPAPAFAAPAPATVGCAVGNAFPNEGCCVGAQDARARPSTRIMTATAIRRSGARVGKSKVPTGWITDVLVVLLFVPCAGDYCGWRLTSKVTAACIVLESCGFSERRALRGPVRFPAGVSLANQDERGPFDAVAQRGGEQQRARHRDRYRQLGSDVVSMEPVERLISQVAMSEIQTIRDTAQ